MTDWREQAQRNIRAAEAYSSSRAFDPPDSPDCLDDCNGYDEETGEWDDGACDCPERIEEMEAEARAEAAAEARYDDWRDAQDRYDSNWW